MKGLFWAVSVFTVSLFFFIGCGNKAGGKLSSADLKVFDSAPEEVKQMWTRALEASKTNDYVGGATLLNQLLSGDLTPQQRDVVSRESTSLNSRLYGAVEKGDPEAQKAVQELRRNAPNRPR